MWRESPEEGTFEYYYAMASEELWDGANPWGSGPNKHQIRNRALQLALQEKDVDYTESPEEETFEYYYAMASEELWDEANPWGGSGPNKHQIRNRALQLALQEKDVDYKEYRQTIAHESWEGGVSEKHDISAIRLRRKEDSHEAVKLTEVTQVLATVPSQSKGLIGPKDSLLQDHSQSKVYLLNELKKEVESQVWDSRGYVFFSHKRKTPEGIKRLRQLLAHYNYRSSSEMEIEHVFKKIQDLFSEKQSVSCCFFNWFKSMFMKRHDLTAEFYDQNANIFNV